MEALWVLHTMNNGDKHRLLIFIKTNIGKSHQLKLSPEGRSFRFFLVRLPSKKAQCWVKFPAIAKLTSHKFQFRYSVWRA